MSYPDKLDPSLRDLILKPRSKKIPRPPNAFMLFARDHRKTLAKKYPTENNKSISSLLGQCWKKLDDVNKAEYYRNAKILEELHKKQYPGYVYCPRTARIQKKARQQKLLRKCVHNNETKDNKTEVLQQTGPRNIFNHGSEKCGEWNDGNSEKKQPSPGYIPNNPQCFPDADHGPQPELPCIAKSEPITASDEDACPSCPPPSWNMSPVESIAVPCTGRCSEECRARSDMYVESYHPKIGQSQMYDYGPWNQYPDYPYESSTSSTWSTCAPGCQGECSTVHPNDDQSSCSYLSSSQHPGIKNSYYHFNSSTPYRNHPYSCSYGPYNDSPMPYVPHRYIPLKTEPNGPSCHFPQRMDHYHNQHQHNFQDYYPKFSYVTRQQNCSAIQETTCSSGYRPEEYECSPVETEEMTKSMNTSQATEFQYQGVEQANTEAGGNEVFSVVDVKGEESNVLIEEVLESTNPEHGQVDQNVHAV